MDQLIPSLYSLMITEEKNLRTQSKQCLETILVPEIRLQMEGKYKPNIFGFYLLVLRTGQVVQEK